MSFFLASVAVPFIDSTLAAQIAGTGIDFRLFLVTAHVLEGSAVLAILITVYSLFRSLDIGRVIPWIWIMGLVGISLSLLGVRDAYNHLGEELFFENMILAIATFTVIVTVFQRYFRSVGRR